jgi:hypothetical protein
MKHSLTRFIVALSFFPFFSSCEKWEDKPPTDLGLTNRYCNVPSAINYNFGFPGIEDNSVCIFPSTPFAGLYSFRDSIYNSAEEFILGDSFNFSISTIDSFRFVFNNFCANTNQLRFVANRFYRAESDSIIGAGLQLMCRNVDTLSGRLEFRPSDSSLLIEWSVTTDTGIYKHRGRAYKK